MFILHIQKNHELSIQQEQDQQDVITDIKSNILIIFAVNLHII